MKQHLSIKDLKRGSTDQLLSLSKWYNEHKGSEYYTQADIVTLDGIDIPLLTIGQILELLNDLKLKGYTIKYSIEKYLVMYNEDVYENNTLIDGLWECLIENY